MDDPTPEAMRAAKEIDENGYGVADAARIIDEEFAALRKSLAELEQRRGGKDETAK